MKSVIYMHVGSGNHGCEALVRTTATLLGGPKDVILWTGSKVEDAQYGSASFVETSVEAEEMKRFSIPYIESLWKRKVLHQPNANMNVFLKHLFKGNVAVSIGGDNYCYPWSAKQNIEYNRVIRKYCAKSVLWGCSIDPEAITEEMKADLAEYDLITARESITYEMLKKINPNTQLVADPAFLLETVQLPLPDGFIEGNTVGVNVSPMIMDYTTDSNMVMANYKKLIENILQYTDMNVCLIPHVVWEYNNDRIPINALYECFAENGRVCKIEDANATELKGYISRCRFFVGARTHATIAAYSTGVPTLVVGYSVKSRGIARDLFGTEEKYVLSVKNLKKETDLSKGFVWLVENETAIKQTLKESITDYKEYAKSACVFMDKIRKG